MIHFDRKLCEKVLETAKEAHDCADVLSDLSMINSAILHMQNYVGYEYAQRLDGYLRKKYPLINKMLDIADTMLPPTPKPLDGSKPVEMLRLEQDYAGILCDTALKKTIIKEIKDFIVSVD